MAIPGVFAPVVTASNEVLVDGGLVNNFPVDVCRAMGADVIIGSEVNPGMKSDYRELNTLPSILLQLLAYETGNGLEQNRSDCDIYIHPSSQGFGTMSFDAAAVDTLIARGYAEAAKHHDALVALKQRLDSYGDQPSTPDKSRALYAENEPFVVNSIDLLGLDDYEEERLRDALESLIGREIVSADIEKSINRFYGLRSFKSITYQILGSEAPYSLVINFEKESPHHFGFGMRYDSDASAALLLSAGYNTNRLRGSAAEATGRLSNSPYLRLAYTYNGGIYTKFNLNYMVAGSRFPWYIDDSTSSHLTMFSRRLDVFVSDANYKKSNWRFGLRLENLVQKSNLSVGGLFDYIDFFGGLYGSLRGEYGFNSLNDSFFPTSGLKFDLQSAFSPALFDVEFHTANAFVLQGGITAPLLVDGSTYFEPSLWFRSLSKGFLVFPLSNYVGGEQAGRYFDQQIPFVGIQNASLAPDHLVVLRADLKYRITPKVYVSGIFNYLCGSYEGYRYFFDRDKFAASIMGAGLKVAVKTLLGPASITFSWSDYYPRSRRLGFYFSLGHYF